MPILVAVITCLVGGVWSFGGGFIGGRAEVGDVFYLEIPIATLGTVVSVNLVVYFKSIGSLRDVGQGEVAAGNILKSFLLVDYLRSFSIVVSLIMYISLFVLIFLFGLKWGML